MKDENIAIVTNTDQIEKETTHVETQDLKSNQQQIENIRNDKKLNQESTLNKETKSVVKDSKDTLNTNTDPSLLVSSVTQGIKFYSNNFIIQTHM